MAFSDVMTTTVFAVLGIVGVGVVADALFENGETLTESERARREVERERLATRIGDATASYDAATSTYTFSVVNEGTVALELSSVSFVLDGAPRFDRAASVDGEVDTDLWLPGERARFVVPSVSANPSHVHLVTEAGASEFLVADVRGLVGSSGEAGVRLVEGAGAAKQQYFLSFSVSEDGSSFRGVSKPKSGSNTTVADVVRVENGGAIARNVTLAGEHVQSPQTRWVAWVVRDAAGAAVGTLSYADDSPTLTFSLPAATTYRLELQHHLATGSTAENGAVPLKVTVGVS